MTEHNHGIPSERITEDQFRTLDANSVESQVSSKPDSSERKKKIEELKQEVEEFVEGVPDNVILGNNGHSRVSKKRGKSVIEEVNTGECTYSSEATLKVQRSVDRENPDIIYQLVTAAFPGMDFVMIQNEDGAWESHAAPKIKYGGSIGLDKETGGVYLFNMHTHRTYFNPDNGEIVFEDNIHLLFTDEQKMKARKEKENFLFPKPSQVSYAEVREEPFQPVKRKRNPLQR